MTIFFAKEFRKNYDRLQSRLQKMCDERLLLFETNPFHDTLNNHSLHGEYAGCRSINVTGDYRAIFYYEGADAVRFIAIGTHHELFGK
jgi:addiction module RelE/StbE family toxin